MLEQLVIRPRSLGANGPSVSPLGLGCMALSGTYGPADDAVSIETIHAALDSGITFLDTADFYGAGHNEMLLRDAMWEHRRDRIFLSLKFGVLWGPDRTPLGLDGRPQAVKNFLAYSLRRLGTDYVDLYQPARVDPNVPIEDTIGAIADLVRQGYVRHVGISEASSETVRRAHATHPIVALQMEYSVLSRGVENEILPTLRELGIGLVAYGVLSRGLLGGDASRRRTPPADARQNYPRFQSDNLQRNLSLVDALRVIAKRKRVSVAQLAIAWVLSRGNDVIALVGARRPDQVATAARAAAVELSADDLTSIELAAPVHGVAGGRYSAAQMSMLDSERNSAFTHS